MEKAIKIVKNIDMRNKLYWWIQHIDEIGGTEVVSIQLMNELTKKYDVECICTSEVTKDIKYDFDKSIKIHSLGMPHEVMRADQFLALYKKQHRIFKIIGLGFKCVHHFIFKRRGYRRKAKKIIDTENSILICSSLDSYLFAPKKVKCIFHYHFNSRLYFDFGNRFTFHFCRKPDLKVFLSESTLNAIRAKKPKATRNATFISNPLRFEQVLDTKKYGNRIIFAGRFANQKNPILALQIANELKEMGFNFTMDMYGDGGLQYSMEKYIEENKLNKYVTLYSPTPNIKEEMQKSDLLLLTSKYEGFGLVRSEANSVSTPVISSNWGDTVYEVIKNGENGYIIESDNPKDYANKIFELLANEKELEKLKVSSYHFVESLSINIIIKKWYEILDQLYEKNSKHC